MSRFDADSPRAATHAGHEWLFTHDWFAGWRWEHHCNGVLSDESLDSFETLEECAAHASQHGYRLPRATPLREYANPMPGATANAANAEDREPSVVTAA